MPKLKTGSPSRRYVILQMDVVPSSRRCFPFLRLKRRRKKSKSRCKMIRNTHQSDECFFFIRKVTFRLGESTCSSDDLCDQRHYVLFCFLFFFLSFRGEFRPSWCFDNVPGSSAPFQRPLSGMKTFLRPIAQTFPSSPSKKVTTNQNLEFLHEAINVNSERACPLCFF